MIERHTPPEILAHGLVTPEDVDELFSMFEVSFCFDACPLTLFFLVFMKS
jgi:hypothetical protein